MTATPNHALQRTRLAVTPPASTAAFPPAMQASRLRGASLSLGSLGDFRVHNRMQRLLFYLLFMVCASQAEPPHPAWSREMPKVDFIDADYETALEFLRTKGTQYLRENTHNESAILIFEYHFAPHLWGQGRGPATYRKTKVPFHEVLRDVLTQFNLEYKIIGPDRIAILDRKKDEPSPAEAVPDKERAKWPKTVDEAVDRLLIELKPADQLEIRSKAKDDLILYHISLGLYIRNSFGLWRGNRALLRSAGENQPDNASGVIIEALWKRLQTTKPK